MLSVSREQDVYMQDALPHKCNASAQALFYPKGTASHTGKSNLLSKNEIKRCLLPPLMGNPDIGVAVIDFMAILQSIDYNKFQRFSNVADEISTRPLSRFCEWEVLVVVLDQHNFEFSIKATTRKYQTEDSIHIQEIEIINNQKITM